MNTHDDFLTFELNNRLFAFPLESVFMVLIDEPIAPTPQAEDFIAGIINFRGELITVIDIEKKFGADGKAEQNKRTIIIIQHQKEDGTFEKLGCLCSAVRTIEHVAIKNIQPPPNFGTYFDPSKLKSTFYFNHELFSVIDVEKVF